MESESKHSHPISTVTKGYDDDIRLGLELLREKILKIAKEENVGPVEETLKWGQPSFLTPATKAGTTLRIDRDLKHGGRFALYVNCRTTLIESWRTRFESFIYGGSRSVHFTDASQIERPEIEIMIAEALTYHRNKRKREL